MKKEITAKRSIPIWVNVMQSLLVLIMLSQVYMFFFDHQMMADSGIEVDNVPMLNLVYEMGARTLVMAIVSIVVIITRNPQHYLIVLIMNVLREGFEMIIDPMYPLLNAPSAPIVDFWIHVIIVAVEFFALIVVYRKIKK